MNETVANAAYWQDNGFDVIAWNMHRASVAHKPALYLGLGETDEWGHGRRYDLYSIPLQRTVSRIVADLAKDAGV